VKKHSTFRAFSVLSLSTFLSRITGYVRDAVIAAFVGTSFHADAFFVAFRIPNLFRRLLGEGALTPAIVPVVSEIKDKQTDFRNKEIKSIISAGFFVLITLTVLGIIFSPYLVKLLAYGFSKNKEIFDITVFLNRLMFPYLFFVCMVAIFMGILNAYHHFFAPSFSQVLLNISMIFSLLALNSIFSVPVYALAVGVLVGGLLQFVFQLPFLARLGVKAAIDLNIFTDSTKTIYKMLIPSFFGLAITQINILVDTLVASFLKEGTISYLYYADRILEIPIGIIVVSFASAILPTLSDNAREDKSQLVREQFLKTLNLCLIFILPLMIAFLFFGKPIISTLFQRRAFSVSSLEETNYALIGYSLGLPFFSFNRIITPLFYAYKKVKSPVKAGFYAMLTNISLDIILMPLGQLGLSLATSISAAVNAVMLYFYFTKEHFNLNIKRELKNFINIFISTIPLLIFMVFSEKFFPYEQRFYIKILYTSFCIAVCYAIYFIILWLLGIKDLKEGIWKIKKRFLK